jgi:hypothetical protein
MPLVLGRSYADPGLSASCALCDPRLDLFFFFFLVGLGFELRVLSLQSSLSTLERPLSSLDGPLS